MRRRKTDSIVLSTSQDSFEFEMILCVAHGVVTVPLISGGGIQMDRALGAKFFKFGMVVGMGIRVSKTIANKLWSISGGHLA